MNTLLNEEHGDITHGLPVYFEPIWQPSSNRRIQGPSLEVERDYTDDQPQSYEEETEQSSEEESIFEEESDTEEPAVYLDRINETSSEIDDEFEKVIAEMHANANLTEIVKEITTPSSLLSDLAVDWFIVNMTNANPNIPFNMTPVLYAQIPKKYKAVSNDRDHLQIVFSGNSKSVGHYILAHFVASENVVKIYDSLYSFGMHGSVLSPSAKNILSRLYPGKRVQFVEPATKQPDSKSCGVFAIAYATTIILGEDPATYQLRLNGRSLRVWDKTMLLRKHIGSMYKSKCLKLFPQMDD